VEQRRLYLKKGHGNLFLYLTLEMGYANGPAQRRIDAARLSVVVPSLIDDIKQGEINLSQVGVVQQSIRQKESELKEAGMKTKQMEALDKAELLNQLKNKSVHESEVIVSQMLDLEMKTKAKIQHQKDESIRLEVTFTKAQWQKLERMRSLVSHSVPDGSWEKVFEYVADKIIASKTKARTGKEKGNAKKSKVEGENKYGKKSKNKKSNDNRSSDNKSKDNRPEEKLKAQGEVKKDVSFKADASTKFDLKEFGFSTEEIDELHASTFSNSFDLSRDREVSEDPDQDRAGSKDQEDSKDQDREETKTKVKPSFSLYQIKKILLSEYDSCQHVDQVTHTKCASTWNLQCDHIIPKWAGGKDEYDNMQVLCAKHNRWRYRVQAGIRFQ
jgi:hypothetical protein